MSPSYLLSLFLLDLQPEMAATVSRVRMVGLPLQGSTGSGASSHGGLRKALVEIYEIMV